MIGKIIGVILVLQTIGIPVRLLHNYTDVTTMIDVEATTQVVSDKWYRAINAVSNSHMHYNSQEPVGQMR